MDHATPNLPSRNFDKTSHFYSQFGFTESWRDEGWMILNRGDIALEFFPHPKLKPRKSSFSCCLRLDDMKAFFALAVTARVPEKCSGIPRLHPPAEESSGLVIAYLIDIDGSLVRLIQN